MRIYRRRGKDPTYAENPFFKNTTLNKCLIIKHRLRKDEREVFVDGRRLATKVIIPLDGEELRLGGRSVLVGQVNYDGIMENAFGESWMADPTDRELLTTVDQLPSLDPFLLREQLIRHGRTPARCYFEISDADLARMFSFVEDELKGLIDLCFRGAAGGVNPEHSRRLVQKILSSAVDAETEPLRQVLRLEKPEYKEGVFCWKGFLYYKWIMSETGPSVAKVSESIGRAKTIGAVDAEAKAYLEGARVRLKTGALGAFDHGKRFLAFYDNAFASLLAGKPQPFREFLLSAPSLFLELGERLGAVSHIVSFWKFRFQQEGAQPATAPELVDILADFEESLAFAPRQQAQPRFVA